MQLDNSKIIFFQQYAAPYAGNFIKSLVCLEQFLEKNYNARVFYVFPEAAKEKLWMKNFSLHHRCYFTIDEVSNSGKAILDLMNTIKPDLVHTHFDGYDMPVTKAVKQFNKEGDIKVVWHLHDHLSFQSNILKKLYQHICFRLHYFYWGKYASVISVGSDCVDFLSNLRKRKLPFRNLEIIPNGIDIDRLKIRNVNAVIGGGKNTLNFKFLAFGGRNVQKRIDVILHAGKILISQDVNFKLVITEGTDTADVIRSVFGNDQPSWVELIPQTEYIAELFSGMNCFISSSVAETFSYAVAEASIFGLPVIQSDIQGTAWNAVNPSTFVFKNMDSESLALKMKEVMSMPQTELMQRCKISQKNNTEKYSLEAWADKVVAFYNKI